MLTLKRTVVAQLVHRELQLWAEQDGACPFVQGLWLRCWCSLIFRDVTTLSSGLGVPQLQRSLSGVLADLVQHKLQEWSR